MFRSNYHLGRNADISEKFTASIFRIEEEAKQETRKKQAASLFGFPFEPEDGVSKYLRIVDELYRTTRYCFPDDITFHS